PALQERALSTAEKLALEREPRSGSLPPGPPLTETPRVLNALRRDPLGCFTWLTRRYGDVVRLRFFIWDAFVVWRPDHVKHVLQDRHTIYVKGKPDYRVLKRILGEGLVTSDGDFWLRQRRLAAGRARSPRSARAPLRCRPPTHRGASPHGTG